MDADTLTNAILGSLSDEELLVGLTTILIENQGITTRHLYDFQNKTISALSGNEIETLAILSELIAVLTEEARKRGIFKRAEASATKTVADNTPKKKTGGHTLH